MEAKLPDNIDRECIALCEAINRFPGIRTIESCCGHGERPYRIWFEAKHLKYLPRLIYYFDVCHCGFNGWKVEVQTDCAMEPVKFQLIGPKGEEGYKQSLELSKLLRDEINNKRVQ